MKLLFFLVFLKIQVDDSDNDDSDDYSSNETLLC